MSWQRIAMGVIFVVGLAGLFVTGPLNSSNGSVESSPEALAVAIFTSLSLLLFPRSKPLLSKTAPYPGLVRRFLTAYIDFCIAMFLALSFTLLISLLYENQASGPWRWSWDEPQMPYFAALEMWLFMMVLLGLYLYFYLHLKYGRPTPAQYIMGYRIVDRGLPDYHGRIWQGGIFMCFWAFASLARTQVPGVYTWDLNSNTQAVIVE